ncbi:MAG: HEAT repeat domain-containing protein, partial [Lentisphaeria bacterium]|nr:HEAT repeat domain-containing protein [Lentisphaeria bacterium]
MSRDAEIDAVGISTPKKLPSKVTCVVLLAVCLTVLPVLGQEKPPVLELNDPDGVAMEFSLLSMGEKETLLKHYSRSGDLRAAAVFVALITEEEGVPPEFDKSMQTLVLPFLAAVDCSPFLAQLQKAVAGGNENVCRYAARILGYSGREASGVLEKLLGSEHGTVRHAAILGLRSLGTVEAAALLKKHAQKKARAKKERDFAMVAGQRIAENLELKQIKISGLAGNFRFLKTPHAEWAKPLAKPPRMLFLSQEGIILRDLGEISQRMNVKWSFAPVHNQVIKQREPWRKYIKVNRKSVLVELTRESRQQILKQLEKDYDVIVVQSHLIKPVPHKHGVTGWPSFPEEVRRAILRKVSSGTGLIMLRDHSMVDEESGYFISSAVPLPSQGGFLPWPKGATAHRFGKGRVMRFPRAAWFENINGVTEDLSTPLGKAFLVPGMPGKSRQVYPSADFIYAAMCRAILWASGQKFPFFMRELTLVAEAGKRGRVEMKLSGNIPAQCKAVLEIVDANHRVVARQKIQLSGNRVSCEIPPLPAGGIVLRVKFLDREGRVLNWGAFVGDVKGRVRIAKVVPPPLPLDPGSKLKADVVLTAVPPKGSTLKAEVIDVWGRVVARTEQATNGEKKISLNFSHGRLLGRLVTLLITLADQNGAPLHFLKQPVVIANTDDFKDVPWVSSKGGAYPQIWKDFAPVYAGNFPGKGTRDVALESLEAGVDLGTLWTFHDTHPNDAGGDERSPCLTSLPFQLGLEKKIKTIATKAAAYDPRFFILGDETGPGGGCLSVSCLRKFRLFMRREYGTLKQLNKIWKSSYKN